MIETACVIAWIVMSTGQLSQYHSDPINCEAAQEVVIYEPFYDGYSPIIVSPASQFVGHAASTPPLHTKVKH